MSQINKTTLFQYFAGKATANQKSQIEHWLNESDENQEVFYRWLEEWERKHTKFSFDADDSFEKLKQRIHQPESPRSIDKKGSKQKHIRIPFGLQKAAAAFLLLVIAGFAYYFFMGAQAHTTYTTAFGETKNITLPDQSTVRLNATSTLSFSKEWDNNSPREIWLEGEAYFSVVHTENDQQFIVHSDEVNVEVLGTEFNVKSRQQETQVVLNSGKVKLSLDTGHPDEEVFMEPGDMAFYSNNARLITKEKVNPQLYTSWRNNELYFDHTPFSEIAELLKNTYGLEVNVSDSSLLEKTFTATLPADNAEILLNALSKSFQLKVQRQGRQVYLQPRN